MTLRVTVEVFDIASTRNSSWPLLFYDLHAHCLATDVYYIVDCVYVADLFTESLDL
jgi:hypothetical protein